MPETASATTVTKTEQQNTDTGEADEISVSDLITQIRYATGLGWSMTELLGRCVILRRVLEIMPPHKPDFFAHTEILSPIRDQRERALAVVGRIRFLAKQLGVNGSKVVEQDETPNNGYRISENGKYYIDMLNDRVNELCSVDTKPEAYKNISASINALLYFWNEEIQVILQQLPPPVYNGYTVGRGFSTIRWYIGIGEADPAFYQSHANSNNHRRRPEENALQGEARNALISEASLFKLHDHLQSLSIYLQPLVPQALTNSLIIWGKAIIENPQALSKEAQHNSEHVKMKRALIKQATIWHDLLTGERDPTTFINPQVIIRHFVGRLLLFILPFLLGGLLLAVAVFVILTYLQARVAPSMQAMPANPQGQSITDTIQNTVTALIAAAATIPFIRTWFLSSTKTATDFISKHPDTITTAGKNALDLLWQQSQQVAVNQKTLVSPRSNPPDVDDGD
ncbi:MAG TPA: hypothetical protein VFA09_01770 [Ktedonobacteraceae bacterium]|nr:hypothetical protein [Ktedonobacteraceae bacterium]